MNLNGGQQNQPPEPPRQRTLNFNPPPFWRTNVPLWFKQVEAQFRVKGVTEDEDKFDLVVSALDTGVLAQVSDVVTTPPNHNKYGTLKDRLAGCFCDSEEKKLQILLKETALGDKKPSHLLREMRELSNNKVGEELLRTLWLQHLPKNVRGILSVSADQTLTALVPLADKVMETCAETSVCELGKGAAVDLSRVKKEREADSHMYEAMMKKIEVLTEQVEALSRGRSSQREHSAARKPSRSRAWERSRERKQRSGTWECRYHFQFGERARRCESPCNFQKNRDNNSSKMTENDRATH